MNSRNLFRLFLLAPLLIPSMTVFAADLSGSWEGTDDLGVRLILEESPDGRLTGLLQSAGDSLPLDGRRQGDSITGAVGPAGDRVPFTAIIQSDQLVLAFGAEDDEQYVFARAVSAPVAAAQGGADQAGTRINGRSLSAADLQRAESVHGLRIPPGDFWYDPVLGAWGVIGGPTYGFIAPGLELGGPLTADASGQGSGVFVNGRELHLYDLLALQQVTGPIMPGRYFITADGLSGFEGGPPLWNLLQLAAQSQAGGGGSNTWQSRITGASGFSDGNTGAVFLPNGGIVSYGD